MSASYKDWFTHRAYYTIFPDVCEDDEDDEPEGLPEPLVCRIEGFRFVVDAYRAQVGAYRAQASFDVEASAPPLKPQIVHGPPRKGRGGKIRRW